MPDVLGKMMSLITGDGEGDSDKDVLLKQLVKEILQNKYAKFYRAKQGEIDPSFAQYLFSLYKTVYPLQQFLRDPAREAKIKQITLEAFLDKQVMDVIKRLSPEVMAERKKSSGAEFPKQLQADLAALSAGFDSPKIATADKCYDLIAYMKQFVFFNFSSFLKKFDPDIKDGDFVTQPKFAAVDASLLTQEVASFLSVIPSDGAGEDWKTVFEILKYCKGGTDVIPLALWNNVLASVNDLKRSRILDLINRLGTGNPIWEIKPAVPAHENLSASFLEQKSVQIREILAGIAGSQRNAQISALVNAVFGAPEITRLMFYIPEKERILRDKDLEGYTYAPALNHLFAFSQDYLSKEIQELCDILLIRGQWTNNAASRQMSEGYHSVIEIAGEITRLDESLDEDGGSEGPRLRGALLRVDRDRSQIRYINAIVDAINEQALDMINRAVPSLIVVGRHFKMLMDDYEKKPFELMMNWKELTLVSKVPIDQRIAAAYKKINYFVQLMILETRPVEEE